VDDRKLFLADPKSGRQSEIVFIPKKDLYFNNN